MTPCVVYTFYDPGGNQPVQHPPRATRRHTDVQVERYLKGSGPATLPVMQATGHETVSPGSGATPGFLNHVRYGAHYYYFERGGRYLLFLRESEHAAGIWTGTAEPYKYQLKSPSP